MKINLDIPIKSLHARSMNEDFSINDFITSNLLFCRVPYFCMGNVYLFIYVISKKEKHSRQLVLWVRILET